MTHRGYLDDAPRDWGRADRQHRLVAAMPVASGLPGNWTCGTSRSRLPTMHTRTRKRSASARHRERLSKNVTGRNTPAVIVRVRSRPPTDRELRESPRRRSPVSFLSYLVYGQARHPVYSYGTGVVLMASRVDAWLVGARTGNVEPRTDPKASSVLRVGIPQSGTRVAGKSLSRYPTKW